MLAILCKWLLIGHLVVVTDIWLRKANRDYAKTGDRYEFNISYASTLIFTVIALVVYAGAGVFTNLFGVN